MQLLAGNRQETIRAWVAEETSDRALGDLLQMNDRLLSLMSQWQAVSEELQAQRQRRVRARPFPQLMPAAKLLSMHAPALLHSTLAERLFMRQHYSVSRPQGQRCDLMEHSLSIAG